MHEQLEKEGLSRMNRNHIHFAPGLIGESDVISGMRKNCKVHIYIDAKRAMAGNSYLLNLPFQFINFNIHIFNIDGIRFYRSENNVILSSGDEYGIISVKYFDRVVEL